MDNIAMKKLDFLHWKFYFLNRKNLFQASLIVIRIIWATRFKTFESMQIPSVKKHS